MFVFLGYDRKAVVYNLNVGLIDDADTRGVYATTPLAIQQTQDAEQGDRA